MEDVAACGAVVAIVVDEEAVVDEEVAVVADVMLVFVVDVLGIVADAMVGFVAVVLMCCYSVVWCAQPCCVFEPVWPPDHLSQVKVREEACAASQECCYCCGSPN